MGDTYIFTLQPTFTQGLVLGQFSILFLLVLILKYLFFDSGSDYSYRTATYQPKVEADTDEDDLRDVLLRACAEKGNGAQGSAAEAESSDWLNILLQQLLESYRSKLRGDKPGLEGDEIARRRVEDFANRMRPAGFLSPIKVHSVNLGVSAPRLSHARRKSRDFAAQDLQIEFDMSYIDTISISLSTSVLFNYPFPSFARLPVSLTISLSLFSSSILLTPPNPTSAHPTVTFSLPSPHTDFTLNLRTTSLMGSRAKLADVPKLHELITHQIRRVLVEKGTWKVVLPGLASVHDVEEDVKREHEMHTGAL
ncbi:maintenance of mitochondrial morphology protein 1 [Obba rivulosa]|uniref:Maintenance of mitochondrial morphology protein 1 n=1 Tax=Obba rivulosa TaxID=1052685 RepID=A0A8E2DVV0_9APHY|nr:maintenance of mitochondrial morphology protein 1 [Obba rivulosa]